MFDPEIKVTREFESLSDLETHALFDSLGLLNDSLLRIVHPIRLQIHTLLVCPDRGEVGPVDDLHVGLALARATHIWNGVHHDFLRRFQDWTFYFSQIYLLKVFDVSYLGRLSDSFTVAESFLAVVSNSLLRISSKSTEQEITTDKRPCATLACIAMNDYYVICILYIQITFL
jgi:hypothetical protein